jgi:hypothetical protein
LLSGVCSESITDSYMERLMVQWRRCVVSQFWDNHNVPIANKTRKGIAQMDVKVEGFKGAFVVFSE